MARPAELLPRPEPPRQIQVNPYDRNGKVAGTLRVPSANLNQGRVTAHGVCLLPWSLLPSLGAAYASCSPPNSGEFGYAANQPLGVSRR